MENITQEGKRERVVTFLDRAEVDFLDKLGKDALFSSGTKLSRTKLIAWLVDFAKALNINGENIKSQEGFENRIRGSVPPATLVRRSQRRKFFGEGGEGTKTGGVK